MCDAREVFATRRRFPMADEVVVDWPNRYLDGVGSELGPKDAICVLTHDAKFDVPAIVSALATRSATSARWGRAAPTSGASSASVRRASRDDQLETIMAPIGLDIGARSPEETAVSIVAEIIATRTGRKAPSLRDSDGSIH